MAELYVCILHLHRLQKAVEVEHIERDFYAPDLADLEGHKALRDGQELIDAREVEGVQFEREEPRFVVDLATHAEEGETFRLGRSMLAGQTRETLL